MQSAKVLLFPTPPGGEPGLKPRDTTKEPTTTEPMSVHVFTGTAKSWVSIEDAVKIANDKAVRFQQKYDVNPLDIQVEPVQFHFLEDEGIKFIIACIILTIRVDDPGV